MKYKFAFILSAMLFSFCSSLFGQAISDPNDRIYKFLTLWYERGFIDRMPVIRPYSLQIAAKLLQEVENKGDAMSQQQAREFKKLYIDSNIDLSSAKKFPSPIHFGLEQNSLFNFTQYTGKNTILATSNGFLSPAVSYSCKMSVAMQDNTDGMETLKLADFYDEAKTGGGVITVGTRTIAIGQNSLAGLFFGNETLVVQAGLMRSSFGPFFDNGPVLTPEAPAAGHFSLTYNGPGYSFSSLFLDLYAKYTVNGTNGAKIELSTATGNPPVTKYLVIHNACFYLTDWMNFGIIQSNLCGGTFNPVFLIPLQQAFFTQQLFGDQNNSLVGFFMEAALPYTLHFKTVLYVDDWDSFGGDMNSGFYGFNIDSSQNKLALQTGLSWSPTYPIFKQLKLSYLMITPYMYTHSAFTPLGYLTYTHDGSNLGSSLEPNSDQLNLSLFLMPFSWMNVDIQAKYTRHGNASEGYEEPGVVSDGTVFDDGFDSHNHPTFIAPSRFLNQSVLEQVLQLGVTTDNYFPLFFTRVNCKLGYTFQYIWNKGLIQDNNELKHFLEFKLSIEL